MRVKGTFKSGNWLEIHVPGVKRCSTDEDRIDFVGLRKLSGEDLAEIRAGRRIRWSNNEDRALWNRAFQLEKWPRRYYMASEYEYFKEISVRNKRENGESPDVEEQAGTRRTQQV